MSQHLATIHHLAAPLTSSSPSSTYSPASLRLQNLASLPGRAPLDIAAAASINVSPRGARAAPEEKPVSCGGLDFDGVTSALSSSPSRRNLRSSPLGKTSSIRTAAPGSPTKPSSAAAAILTPAAPRQPFRPTARPIKTKSHPSPNETDAISDAMTDSTPLATPRAAPSSFASSHTTPTPLTSNPSLGNSTSGGAGVAAGDRKSKPTPTTTTTANFVPYTPGSQSGVSSLEARKMARRLQHPPLRTPGGIPRPSTPLSRPITPSSQLPTPTADPTTPRPTSPAKVRAKLTDGVSARKVKRPGGAAPSPNVIRSGPPLTMPNVGGPSSSSSSSSAVRRSPQKRRSSLKGVGISSYSGPIPSYDLSDESGECSFFFDDDERGGGVGEVGYGAAAEDDGDGDGQGESVMVHVRIRPAKVGEKTAWVAVPRSAQLALDPSIAATRVQPGSGATNTFDGVHTGSSNGPVYTAVARPLVRSALAGYDAVIFAYGQTASGKTFTLSGDEQNLEPGIIPRAVRDLFRGIRQSSKSRQWLLRASYLEIHNENVKDLLDPSNAPQIREERKKGGRGIHVSPLTEEVVTSPAQVRDLLARGQINRHVGATDFNERSSRSHTCFELTIESWERDAEADDLFSNDGGAYGLEADSRAGKKVRISKLSLIDLAGSEKYVSQGADRRAEGANINKSLLTLGKVIYALAERSSSPSSSAAAQNHVPYRDSKLTRILQNSLSGSARVAVVCTLNPSPGAVDESLSTLNFAKRVKKVSVHARRNEVDGLGDGDSAALVLHWREEAVRLRRLLEERGVGGAAHAKAGASSVDEVREAVRAFEENMRRYHASILNGQAEQETDVDFEYAKEAHVGGAPPPVNSVGSGTDYALQEELFNAQERIKALEQQLSSVPRLPPGWEGMDSASKEAEVLKWQRRCQELEIVCEEQKLDPPIKEREDMEREWIREREALEERLRRKDAFAEELKRKCNWLEMVNARLRSFSSEEASKLLQRLASAQRQQQQGADGKSSSSSSSMAGVTLPHDSTRRMERPASAMDHVARGSTGTPRSGGGGGRLNVVGGEARLRGGIGMGTHLRERPATVYDVGSGSGLQWAKGSVGSSATTTTTTNRPGEQELDPSLSLRGLDLLSSRLPTNRGGEGQGGLDANSSTSSSVDFLKQDLEDLVSEMRSADRF